MIRSDVLEANRWIIGHIADRIKIKENKLKALGKVVVTDKEILKNQDITNIISKPQNISMLQQIYIFNKSYKYTAITELKRIKSSKVAWLN